MSRAALALALGLVPGAGPAWAGADDGARRDPPTWEEVADGA